MIPLVRIAVKTVAAVVLLAVLVLAGTAGRVWWFARQDDTAEGLASPR